LEVFNIEERQGMKTYTNLFTRNYSGGMEKPLQINVLNKDGKKTL